jgi:hypothetical protein
MFGLELDLEIASFENQKSKSGLLGTPMMGFDNKLLNN